MTDDVYLVSDEKREQLDDLIARPLAHVAPAGPQSPVRVAGWNTSGIVTGADTTSAATVSATEQFMGGGVKVFQRVGFTQFRFDSSNFNTYGHDQLWLAGPGMRNEDYHTDDIPYLVVGKGSTLNIDTGASSTVGVANICAAGLRLAELWDNAWELAAGNPATVSAMFEIYKENSGHYGLVIRNGQSAASWLFCEHRSSPSGADQYIETVTSNGTFWGDKVRATNGYTVGGLGASQVGSTVTTGGLNFVGGILVGGALSLTAGGGAPTGLGGASAGAILYSNGTTLQSSTAANFAASGARFQVDVGTDRQLSFLTGSY